jgi:hypothetical protein
MHVASIVELAAHKHSSSSVYSEKQQLQQCPILLARSFRSEE